MLAIWEHANQMSIVSNYFKHLKHQNHQLKYDTVPMTDVWHFFVEYLFILENEVWQFEI